MLNLSDELEGLRPEAHEVKLRRELNECGLFEAKAILKREAILGAIYCSETRDGKALCLEDQVTILKAVILFMVER